jgi:cephalosporin-C deacetylase-like acetyl esterase
MFSTLIVSPLLVVVGQDQAAETDTRRGEAMIDAYFLAETARLQEACLANVSSLEQWKARRDGYRRELLDMLGLDPMPKRTDLKATVTGTVDHERFTVENLHFQSRPGLYVTGNLYLPKGLTKPAPAILYVCGHARSKQGDVSFGNKVSYQRHGCWFAQNGYVCLTIDSLQLGEIEATHHGTYRYGLWWWNNRGYTPAGVEAWNCVRALDYLQSRPEVDPDRLGVTGRSGGGAYSWWIAAIDERIQAAVPVAGITDLENHVVTGCVEGHCDCMYFANLHGWDYPLVAALVAPRPLMIGNSDNDRIFPLDGVTRTYEKARRIYELYGAGDKIALNITEGPHKDTPELRIPAFRWFNRHLKGEDPDVEDQPEGPFEPQELRVFDALPADQRNTEIHETFVAAAAPEIPATALQWQSMCDDWRQALLAKPFRGWPDKPEGLDLKRVGTIEQRGRRVEQYEFTSQGPVRLPLFVVSRPGSENAGSVILRVLDESEWQQARLRLETDSTAGVEEEDPAATTVYFCPRGVGPTAWYPSEKKQVQIRRRFMLLGQTLDGMRVWDVRRAIQAVRSMPPWEKKPLRLCGQGVTAGVVLYAAMFEPGAAELQLDGLPPSHRQGPVLLGVRRVLDLPQAVAMAGEGMQVEIVTADPAAWTYPIEVAEKLAWPDRIQLREPDPLASGPPAGP